MMIRDCKHLIKLQCTHNRTNAFKVCESEFRRNSKIQMINFDDYANENKTERKLKWPCISDHPYRILIIGGNECIIKFNKQPAR